MCTHMCGTARHYTGFLWSFHDTRLEPQQEDMVGCAGKGGHRGGRCEHPLVRCAEPAGTGRQRSPASPDTCRSCPAGDVVTSLPENLKPHSCSC